MADDPVLGEVMDLDTYRSFYKTNSVDKDDYWKVDVNSGSLRSIRLHDTAVFNGNAVSQYLNRTGQAFAGVFVGIPGGVVALEGSRIRDKSLAGSIIEKTRFASSLAFGNFALNSALSSAIDENLERYIGERIDGSYEAHLERSELMGEKMVNYGIYLADQGKDIIREMERSQPTTNPVAGFLGDATGSVLATLGLVAMGGPAGPALAIGTFGLSSGLDVSTEALKLGADSDTALAAGILTGAAVSGLEAIGLKSIFKNTAKSGVRAATMHFLEAAAAEGITEGLQEVVELGASYAVGGQRDLTLSDALGQIAYASAVGAFAGGAMVTGVTLKRRAQAISITQRVLGVDKGTATRVYTKAEQGAMDEVFSRTGEATGYDAIQNRTIQNMRDVLSLARGEMGVSNETAERILESLKIQTPGEQILGRIRAESIADANAAVDAGDIKETTVPGKKAVDQATVFTEQLEQTEAQRPPEFKTVSQEAINNVKPIYRTAYLGRIRELTRVAKDARKQLLLSLKLQGAKGNKINTGTIQKLIETYINSTTELTYLKDNPGDIVFTGDNAIQLKNAEVLGKIADNQIALILRNVKLNFRRGRQASQAEFAYVKAVIKQLLNRPGISQSQKFEQLGRWLNNIKNPVDLQKKFTELELKVEDILTENLVGTFKQSIDNIIDVMRGKVKKGQPRRVKLPARAQKLADTFIKAYKDPGIDPAEEGSGTPEGRMRTYAARLATGINVDGSVLTPRDYINIERTLRRFVQSGTLEFKRQRAIKEGEREKQREAVLDDLDKTKGIAKTPAREAWEKSMDFISRRFNYDALISSLAKGMGTEIGSSAFEAVMDFSKAHIKNETLNAYFTSRFNQGAMKIFGVSSTLELSKKFVRDNINDNQVVVAKDNDKGAKVGFWNGTIAQAREKYMLWLSPEGQTIMRQQGWAETEIDSLLAQMTEADTAFIALQLDVYAELYEPINETYKNLKGFDLNFRQRYSPVYRTGLSFERTNMIDQVIGEKSKFPGRDDPTFTKQLTRSEKKLKDVADFQKMRYYIKDATYYAGMAEKVDQVAGVLDNTEVREKIEDIRNKDFYNRLKTFIDIMHQGKRYGNGPLNSTVNNWVTNMQKMLLAGKVVLFPKQLVSGLAALEVVNGIEFAKYTAELPAALKDGSLSKFLEHPYFAHRSMRRAISRDIFDINLAFESGVMTERRLKKVDIDLTLNHFLFLATQLGDMGGVVLNGWSVYRHYQAEGMSDAEAANKATAHIDRTQQSARVTQQIGVALNPDPISRAFTSFTHAPMQYASILVQQLDTLGTDRFNAKQFARTYAIFFTVLPMLYAAVGRAFDYRKEDTPQYIAEFALGPFDDIPLTGGLLRVLVARATFNVYKNTVDEDAKRPISAQWGTAGTGLFKSMIDNLADAERALTKEYEDGFKLKDFLHITTQLAEASGPLGGTYSGLARTISGGAEGVALMSEENGNGTTVNSIRRLLMLAGYSEYATRPTEE